MSVDIRLSNPFSRLVKIKAKSPVHGLIDPEIKLVNNIKQTQNRVYHKGGSRWKSEPVLDSNLEQFKDILPGKFSGEMRAVVQDNISRGWVIDYDYHFSQTHGIYTAGDGSKWVIEITPKTVSAWPLKHYKAKRSNEAVVLSSLDYLPARSPKSEASRMFVLGDISATLGGRTALYPECGWAFSKPGHKACVVTFEQRTDAPNAPGRTYGYSRLWEIAITGTNTRPSGVTITELESGWLWGNKLVHFKYPDHAKSTLLSYDWWRQNYAPPWIRDADGNYPEQKPPIHAWYKGESLQVVRYHTMVNKTSGNYPDTRPSSNLTVEQYRKCRDGEYKWGTNGTEKSYLCFSTPANPKPLAVERKFGDWGELKIIGQYQFVEYDNGNRWADEARGPADRVQAILYSGGRTDKTNWDTVIIPFNDREAVAHYQSASDATTPPATTKSGGYRSIEWLVLTDNHKSLLGGNSRYQSGWLTYSASSSPGSYYPMVFNDYSYDILFMYTQNSGLPAEVVSGVEWYSNEVSSYSGRFKWMGRNASTYAYGSTYQEAGKRYVEWRNDESAKSSSRYSYDEYLAKYKKAVHSYTKVGGLYKLSTIGVGTENRGNIFYNVNDFYLIANRIGKSYRYTGGSPITEPAADPTDNVTEDVTLLADAKNKSLTPTNANAWKAFVDPDDTSYYGIKASSQWYGVASDNSERKAVIYLTDPVTGSAAGQWRSDANNYPATEIASNNPSWLGNP